MKDYFYFKSLVNFTEEDKRDLELLLRKAAEIYYAGKSSFEIETTLLLTDEQYDSLLEIFNNLCGIKTNFAGENKDDNNAFSNVLNKKHENEEFLCTLAKAKNIIELEKWIKNLMIDNPDENNNFILSPKYDGNSISIKFVADKDDKSVYHIDTALTRGKNGLGKDITKVLDERFATIKDKKGVLLEGKPFLLKFEVVMSRANLARLNNELNKKYKNPRNVISGIFSSEDAKRYIKYLTFVKLDLETLEDDIGLSRIEKLQAMQSLKDTEENEELYNESMIMLDYEFIGLAGIKKIYEEKSDVEKRNSTTFMEDGLVIEVLDEDIRRELGSVKYGDNYEPKYAIALKYPAIKCITKITSIEFDFGNTGIITPCVTFEPIILNGNTYSRVSIANYKRFKENKFRIGEIVEFSLENDVLGYIEKADIEQDEQQLGEFVDFLKKCPHCGGEIEINEKETFAFCSNEKCLGRIVGQAVSFVNKMGFKGIESRIVNFLFENEYVSSIPELLRLKNNKELLEELKQEDGWGEKSVQALVSSLSYRDNTEIFDYELLGSIGIEDIGEGNAKELCKNIDFFKDILTNTKYELGFLDSEDLIKQICSFKGFSEIRTKHLLNGLDNIHNFILLQSLFTEFYPNYIAYKDYLIKNASPVDSLIVVVTGNIPGIERPAFKALIEKFGHKMTSAVSKKTNYLLTEDQITLTEKLQKARELNIPIINAEEFKAITGIQF